MAEHSGLFNATNNSPEYAAANLARFFNLLASGVAYGYGNQLEVVHDTGLQISIDSGGLVSKGWFYVQDEDADGASPKTLSIDAATAGYLRKDKVVVEFDTDNATGIVKIEKGTESVADPTAPTLLDTSTKWQVSLAAVNVSGGTISSIEDERVIGNGRTNPVFTQNVTAPNLASSSDLSSGLAGKANLSGAAFSGDISAPNVNVKDSGRLYLNTAETAYLRYTSNALYLKLPSCTEVQVAMVVVGTSESAPSGTYPVNTMYLERDA